MLQCGESAGEVESGLHKRGGRCYNGDRCVNERGTRATVEEAHHRQNEKTGGGRRGMARG